MLTSLNGNVIPLDGTELEKWETSKNLQSKSDSKEYLFEDAFSQVDPVELSGFAVNSIVYMSGWVVRKLLHKVDCSNCKLCLVSPESSLDSEYSLIRLRDNGGLLYPSKSVVRILKVTESIVRGQTFQTCTVQKVQSAVLIYIGTDINTLFADNHSSADDLFSHSLSLIRALVRCYVNIRQFSRAKSLSLTECKSHIRHVLTKQILFKNQ